jgi:hypothetical protein
VERTDRTGAAPLARPCGSTGYWLRAGLTALCIASGLIGARPALAGEATRVSAGIEAGPLATSASREWSTRAALAVAGACE